MGIGDEVRAGMSGSLIVMGAWIATLEGKGYRVGGNRIAICMGLMYRNESNEYISQALDFHEIFYYLSAEVCSNPAFM